VEFLLLPAAETAGWAPLEPPLQTKKAKRPWHGYAFNLKTKQLIKKKGANTTKVVKVKRN